MHRQTHRAGPTRLVCYSKTQSVGEDDERYRVEHKNVRAVQLSLEKG